jgi:hypothetical protein
MHLISDPNELKKIYSYLPVPIEQAASMSREALFGSCHPLCCDLEYSSVMQPSMLGKMSTIVGEMKELRLYVLHCDPASFGAAPSAFEITTMSLPGAVTRELESGDNRDAYLRVFYFTGRFAIVSSSADWVIFAETDDFAFFSASDFRKFALFNARWWTHEYQDGVLPIMLQEEHMKTWDLLYPKHKGEGPGDTDG